MAVPSIVSSGGSVAITSGTTPRTVTSFNIGTPGSDSTVYFVFNTADDGDSITGVTWNGVACTEEQLLNDTFVYDLSVWSLASPAGGNQTLSFTYSGDGTYGGQVFFVLVDGVGTVTFFTANSTGTSVSTGTQTCPTNGMILAFAVHNFSTTAPSSTAGTDLGITMPSNRRNMAGYRTSTGAVSWTLGSSQAWSLIGVLIEEVSGGGSSYFQTNTGSVTGTGSISKLTQRNITGSSTFSNILNKHTTRIILGSMSSSGDPNPTSGISQSISGSVSVSGSILTQVLFVRSYNSIIQPTGGLVKAIDKLLSGVLTLTGSAYKGLFKFISGTFTLSGTVNGLKFTPTTGRIIDRGMRFMRKFIGRR